MRSIPFGPSLTVVFGAAALCAAQPRFTPAISVSAFTSSHEARAIAMAVGDAIAKTRCFWPSRAYSVDGVLTTAPTEDGREFKIEWLVRNAAGDVRATINQRKAISADELANYGWDEQAEGAAQAAVRGFLKVVCPHG